MPRGSEKQKMEILPHGKWELPANQCRPICQPWHGMACHGFSFFVFLNPWASMMNIWIVYCLGNNFLFNSILAGCGTRIEIWQAQLSWLVLRNKKTSRIFSNYEKILIFNQNASSLSRIQAESTSSAWGHH